MKKRVIKEMDARNHSLFSMIKSANFFIMGFTFTYGFVKCAGMTLSQHNSK
jgi:hypothetical protein